MAIYHLSVKPVQRSKGRSATAAAAYRASERIACEREGVVHDYTRKTGVDHQELIGWSGTRAELWNAAEAAERRKDATTAREYEIALPAELPRSQQIALARRFGAWLHDRHGVAVDICLHDLESPNPHAHVLTSTRLSTQGELGGKAAVEWSDKKRRENGLPGRKQELEAARQQWADMANAALALAGEQARIDHRSLQDQAKENSNVIPFPTTHLGPVAHRLEKRGRRTAAGDRNRRIQKQRSDDLLTQIRLDNVEREIAALVAANDAETTAEHTEGAAAEKTPSETLSAAAAALRRGSRPAPEPAPEAYPIWSLSLPVQQEEGEDSCHHPGM